MVKIAQKLIKETTLKTVRSAQITSRSNNRLTEMMKEKVMRQPIRIMESPRMKLRIIKTRTIQELVMKMRATLQDNKALRILSKAPAMVKQAQMMANKALPKASKALRMANKLPLMINKAPQVIRVAMVVRQLFSKVTIITKHLSVTEETRIMETHRAIPHRRKNRKTPETAASHLLKMTVTLSCVWRSVQSSSLTLM